MKYLIIDWRDGRHLFFEDFLSAEKEYNEITKDITEELDIMLLEVKREINNID